MLPDRVSNPGPLTYESGALPLALRDPAHLNRKDEKMYVEIQKFDFFRKQNGENFFFLVQMFSSPMGYLACIMFRMPRQYF